MSKEIVFLRLFFVLYIVGLSALLGGSAYWNSQNEKHAVLEYTRIEAEASFNKDLLFRQWNAMHGGVYVPITEMTPSNPHLEFIRDRDIVTTSGKRLTLVNPAYMMRQVFELGKDNYAFKGHITSLEPLRPENETDEWEANALRFFEAGYEQHSSIEDIEGVEYLRYMHVLKVEQKCLRCHQHQGYKLGDVRGGISIAIPTSSYKVVTAKKNNYFIVAHIIIYLILLVIGTIVYRFSRHKLLKLSKMQSEALEREQNLSEQNSKYLALNNEYKTQNIELKSANEDIQRRKQEYSDVVEKTSELIITVDADGKFIFVNHSSNFFLGLSPDECIGKYAFDFIYHEDVEYTRLKFEEWIASDDRRFYLENRQQSTTGKVLDVAWTINIERENGEVVKVTSIGRDISKQKEVEREILIAKENAEKSETLLTITGQIAKVGGWEIDVKKQILTWSDVVYSIHEVETDYKPSIRDAINFYDDESKPIIDKAVEEAVRTGQPFDVELGINTQKGNHKNVKAIGYILNDKDGKLAYIIGIFQDITEQSRLVKELTASKEKAVVSDRLKTAFLQNMSHEIRTPMNAIMGFSSLLSQNFENKGKLEQFSKIIYQRSSDLLDIINDILDISKIESGQLTLNTAECNIIVLLDELKEFFHGYQLRLDKKHLQFSIDCSLDKTNAFVKTDIVKLKQVLINLISNAFKYTEVGSVKCTCGIVNNNLLFQIIDTGIGIPSDKQDTIFDRFTQIRNADTYTIGGTGLGLSIAKGLTDLLGGQIWFESDIRKGTVFYFSIKNTQASIESVKLNGNVTLEISNDCTEKTILIVEDDLFNADYLKEILTNEGFYLLVAKTGSEAIEIATSKEVDLILMDVRLPDMNGYEITRQILKEKPLCKIIAQTAFAGIDEKVTALKSGCVDYISKPTNKELLLEMISKHLCDDTNH